MHQDSLNHIDLYCTSCCSFEGEVVQHKLSLNPGERSGEYILSGKLTCPNCGMTYPISGGVPCLAPGFPGDAKLNTQYLDAHYGELNRDYWAAINTIQPGKLCLDVGCSVGRYTFECARDGFAVGIDLNLGQLQAAAEFQRSGKFSFSRKTRSLASERVEPAFAPSGKVLFILADVNNPPFRMETFDFISGLNLIDSVKRPLTVLGQMDAMLAAGGRLLLSSPYAWDPAISEEWLETEETAPHDFVIRLLTGELLPETGFDYEILTDKTGIPWRVRRHDSLLFEYSVDIILGRKNKAESQ